jgi:hypothetical protein
MDLLMTQSGVLCKLCPLQEVGLHGILADDNAKHTLFHEAWDHCDNPDFERLANLCSICRHLRIRHLLICVPNQQPELYPVDDEKETPLKFLMYPDRK